HFEGSCRADTAAYPGAARRGGTDGIRPHRDSPPIAAAAVAAFAAADRGGPSGPFPRGILGLLPSRRTRRHRRACPRAYRPAPDRRRDRVARPRAAPPPAPPPRRRPAGLLSGPPRRMGPES